MVSFFNSTPDAIKGGVNDLSLYTHPDYLFEKPNWDMLRDIIQGERRIKEQGTVYLPGLISAKSGTTYEDYKGRATFVNMTGRTISGLVGTVFRRPVKVSNVEKAWLENVTADGLHFNLFCKKATIEAVAMGRIGILVDMPPDGSKPYLCEYIAENIISWKTEVRDGRKVPIYVLLREIVDQTPMLTNKELISPDNFSMKLQARYRALYLDESGIYRQQIFLEEKVRDIYGGIITVLAPDGDVITPTRRGAPFRYIPMVCIGPMQPTFDVQKSPVLDIAFLNIAHYKSSAQLEHGRFFTALPVYYVPISGQSQNADYDIGPSVVWEVPEGVKPGILEYFGTGLKNLADSLVEKEEAIASLGGRIMGISPAAAAESETIYKMKQVNEMSILINITESMSAGMTQCLRWLLDWQRLPAEDVEVKFNQDFNALQIQARELRAIAVMYQSGILPLPEVFRVLQDSGFIDDSLTLAEFEDQLRNLENFPGQPDVEAMHEGYGDANQRTADVKSIREQRMAERQAEMEREHKLLADKRKADQASDLQEEAFDQGLTTIQWEAEVAARAAKEQAKLDNVAMKKQADQDIRVNKAKPVSAAKGKPAKAKPAAGSVSKVKPARKSK